MGERMKRATLADFARYWLPVILWFLIISIFSAAVFSGSLTFVLLDRFLHWLIPGIARATVLLTHGVLRKTAHFVEFFVLGLLIYRAFRRGRPSAWRLTWALLSCALAAGLAVLDEFHQLFVPGRVGSLTDSGLDSAGALAAMVLVYARAYFQSSAIKNVAMSETQAEK